MKKLVVVLVVATVAACGHRSVTAPSTTASPAVHTVPAGMLSLRAARTGAAVSGAAVRGAATRTLIGATGSGPMPLPGVVEGDDILIEASGFLPRAIKAHAGSMNEYLIEDDEALPRQFTEELVYGVAQGGVKNLQRPVMPVLTIVPEGEMLTNRRVRDDLPMAVDAVNAVLATSRGQSPRFVVDPAGSAAAFKVELVLNPANPDNPGELTWAYPDGSEAITKCKIELAGIDGFWGFHLQRVFEHAMMHCLGLVHAPGFEGIMGNTGAPNLIIAPMEAQVVRDIFLRKPGNRLLDTAPDVSAGVTTSSEAPGGMRDGIVCAYPMPGR